MDLQLNGQVAVVTGASKGIGLAITRTLLAEGMRVVAASRGDCPEPDALHVAVDLTEPEAPAQLVAAALDTYGRLDAVVNNAGGPVPGSPLPHAGFLSRGDDDWHGIFELNLHAVVRLCRAALPVLVETGGAIVNVSSANARQPSPFNVEYSAAKAALTNLSTALSEEFAPQGVRVNTVSPGPVLTPWWTAPGGAAERFGAMVGADAEAVLSTVGPQMMSISTGRLADPQEIADAVAYLVSPRSASTTGTDLVVDGGLLKTA
ncbi:SDR family oxidoreductase [Solirubrobacter sp. CPCC 204708]|uniref:SDR family oxidoreductase n=1 Tax=Solirubrobacter deserti TaxID=2282478 RepID=A0ABT4RKI1_9ACTN|nr:SDR family oxidoreductase [Solirubrobacter deserti]MBE2315818.1 SDR family oxidoreductase [Solirubrobacter deserti]MDA0138846.1 SDR family oxidoreductase [Solirubrobacter deserti]